MAKIEAPIVSVEKRRWLPCAFVAFLMALVGLVPQVYYRLTREQEWRAPYVSIKGDESFYAAYVNALADGRPRRNDPFRGLDDEPGAPLHESYLSIQFLPAYALAFTARTLGVSVPDLFAVLPCIAGFFAALAMYWLIKSVTGDALWAATGTLFVLCLGTLVTLFGPWLYARDPGAPLIAVPFLRRYEPAFPFPFLIAYFAVVWRMLMTDSKVRARVLSVVAALIFGALVFSYFYLWTAAAAWLALLTLLTFALRPEGWRERLKLLCATGGLSLVPLVPYAMLIAGRDASKDGALDIIYRHTPHVFFAPLWLGLLIVAFLILAHRRGWLDTKSWKTIFVLSLALLPLIVFNQQVVTGRSLQPFHYELFVTNYGVLLAFVLLAAQLWRVETAQGRRVRRRVLICAATVALCWAVAETIFRMRRFDEDYRYVNNAQAVSLRLAELGHSATNGSVDTHSLVLAADGRIADYLPTVAPQGVLWGFNMNYIPVGTLQDEKERLLHYLYYTNANPAEVYERRPNLRNERTSARAYMLNLFRRELRSKEGKQTPKPEEERALALEYSTQFRSFDRERAARLPLSYLIVATDERDAVLRNVDRFYERDAGEPYGRFMLYRLQLRP